MVRMAQKIENAGGDDLSDTEMKDEDNEEQDAEEENEDAESSNDEISQSDEDDEFHKENERRSSELLQLVEKDPFQYDAHVELIKILREMGELERLRNAREKMSELFPLTPELWLDWLRDEIPIATTDDERRKIEQLFERAVKDYLSVDVWLEYVQYSIGGIGSKDGVTKIREVFERALTAGGLHTTLGSNLWEAYREFENAVLAGLMPQPGQVPTPQQQEDFKLQNQRVNALFKRQLSVPLFDMEETYAEMKEWLQEEEIDTYTNQAYKKALSKLQKIKPYEDGLQAASPPRLEEYQSYIKYELSEGDPARIQCIYERAIQENCLNSDLWLDYTKFLDTKLKVQSVVMSVYERSVRNCPWCAQLWRNYMLAQERFNEPLHKVKETIDKALSAGFSQGSDYLVVWSTFCDYLRRRIKWDEDHEDQLEKLRGNLEGAVQHLSYYPDADPNCTLRQFWATIEAKYCKNMERARELWNGIMTEGHGNEAVMWLEFYRMERAYGDNKHCRKVLQRAMNSVSDWPETIVDAWIEFERVEGTLEQYDLAVSRCEAQMERINERREKAAEKEAESQSQKKQTRSEKKSHKKEHNKQNTAQNRHQNKHQQRGHHHQQQQQSQQQQNEPLEQQRQPPKYKRQPPGVQQKQQDTESQQEMEVESQESGRKRKLEDADSEGKSSDFKTPAPPGFKGPSPGYKGQNKESTGPPPGYKGPKKGPPPGYKGKGTDTTEVPPAKVAKIDEEEHGQGDTSHYNYEVTAFVSNLDYSVGEDRIGEIFSKCGEIVDIRLVKTFNGKSKGYAYVEFKDELCVQNALKLDRTNVEGRPMYVSKCEDKNKQKTKFMYSTGLEKRKLFVKGLPYTCSKEALETIFGEYGKLKDVRIVTYKSGAPKGLAYIEYEDEQNASTAIVKTDGLMIGEHTISVAISNPPGRKMPLSQRDETSFVPTLGSGKKETEIRGKARTQLSLLPRSLQKPPGGGAPKKGSANQKAASNVQTHTANGQSESKSDTSKMSNQDFRNMLLKK
ncbi:hypothetical protein KUTeg_009963 [Tegillarca granosa]|uniref:RRM domain-containing protein n=1 Tax=Tegillarca granosa TaxID=220873 RepID=A0ABQ9F5E1_TEGGR|nr:hypothetical protein KUTeg_009963 [Tegillarca granosa]